MFRLCWWGWLYQLSFQLAPLTLKYSTPEIKGQPATELPGPPILCSTALLQTHVLWTQKRVSSTISGGLHKWEHKGYIELTISAFFTDFFLVILFLPRLWQLQATLIFHSSMFQYYKPQGFRYNDEALNDTEAFLINFGGLYSSPCLAPKHFCFASFWQNIGLSTRLWNYATHLTTNWIMCPVVQQSWILCSPTNTSVDPADPELWGLNVRQSLPGSSVLQSPP